MDAFARFFQAAAATCALLAQMAQAQTPPPPNPPAPGIGVRVVEFDNMLTGRHVWLTDPAEIAAVESGTAGAGWARDGYYFDTGSLYDESRVDVCRFYAPGSNSHFFTANAQECSELRANSKDWIYEKVAFRAYPPPREFGCGGEIYRLYNNRGAYGDAAHRFTPDRALRKRLIEEGWVDEGVAFCVSERGRETQRSWVARSRGEGPRTDCEDPASNLGTCVMMRTLPAMPRTMPVTSGDLALLTGYVGNGGTLYTSQSIDNIAGVRANSFVQVSPPGSDAPEDAYQGQTFGFRLVGSNRVAGDLATLGLVHQFPTAVLPPQADERVFPWSDGREHDLALSFAIETYVEAYLDDFAQAYGGGVLRFQDRTTGRALMVSLAAWGRMPPGSAVMRDIFTGQPIVATSFGDGASFGTSDGPAYVQCGERCIVSLRLRYLPYSFRIARADFAKVIAMARQINPALSGDPADYMVSSFQYRGETYRDAEIAFTVAGLTLSLSK